MWINYEAFTISFNKLTFAQTFSEFHRDRCINDADDYDDDNDQMTENE